MNKIANIIGVGFQVLGLLLLCLTSCQPKIEIERPLDPWAFRSVLDKKPSEISLSEDRRKCRLFIPGLKEQHIVYFLLSANIKSNRGNPLWQVKPGTL